MWRCVGRLRAERILDYAKQLGRRVDVYPMPGVFEEVMAHTPFRLEGSQVFEVGRCPAPLSTRAQHGVRNGKCSAMLQELPQVERSV